MQSNEDFATAPRIADLDSDAGGVRLGEWMRQPERARWRRIRTVAVALVLLVTVAALLRVSWAALTNGSAPPALPANTIIIDSNVTYGTLRVNDRSYAMQPWMHVQLRDGVNHLTLNVPPFNAIHCALTAPVKNGDDRCVSDYSTFEDGNYVPVVTLTVGETDLSPAAQQVVQADLTRALQNITVTTTLSAGEWYGTGTLTANGLPQVRRTTTSVFAALQASLDASAALSCGALLCPNTFGAVPRQTGNYWQMQVPVKAAWTITDTQTGQAHTYPLPSTGIDTTTVLALDAFYDGRDWSFSNTLHSMTTPGPQQQLAEIACEAGEAILAGLIHGNISFAPNSTSGTGCALIYTDDSPSANVPPVIAHFIVRAGALLATDAAAHRLLPGVPVATNAESAAVGAGG